MPRRSLVIVQVTLSLVLRLSARVKSTAAAQQASALADGSVATSSTRCAAAP